MTSHSTGGRTLARRDRIARRGAGLLVIAILGACLQIPTESYPTTENTLGLFHFSRSGHDKTWDQRAHGFLLDRGDATPLAITAYHVAGPVAFYPTDPLEVSAFLVSPVLPTTLVRLGRRLTIPGAHVLSFDDTQWDIAAFHVYDWKPARALPLGSVVPAVGDTVFVLSLHIPGFNPHPLSGPRRHRARVDVSTDSTFTYTYLESANANYTSGAAVLDSEGSVVGINVGTNVLLGGPVMGMGVGLTALRTHLSKLP